MVNIAIKVPKREYGISILETVDSIEKLPQLLNDIAQKIAEGYEGGYNPSWEIVDEGAKNNG